RTCGSSKPAVRFLTIGVRVDRLALRDRAPSDRRACSLRKPTCFGRIGRAVDPSAKRVFLFLTLAAVFVAVVVAFERGLIDGIMGGVIVLVVAMLIAAWMPPAPEGPYSPDPPRVPRSPG